MSKGIFWMHFKGIDHYRRYGKTVSPKVSVVPDMLALID